VSGRDAGEQRVSEGRPVVDRDADGVPDRTERTRPAERTEAAEQTERAEQTRRPERAEQVARDERATRAGQEGVAGRVATRPEPATAERQPTGVVPVAPATAAAPEVAAAPAMRVRGRTSVAATLALVLGLSGLYGALSGRLAPVGLALSILGLLLAFLGLRADRPAVADRAAFDKAADAARAGSRPVRTFGRRAVAGGGLASFALLISVAGIVVAALALGHASTWLDSDADQVTRARDWLDARLPWLADW
jgi:hypothetical protein